MLDAKQAEDSVVGGKKKGADENTIISEYMQKKDDLEFRTL